MSPRRNQRRRSSPSGRRVDAADGIVVNGYSERWLRQGFPWVYRDEVVARTGALKPGSVVSIRSKSGVVLGTGIWASGKIEIRRFRTDEGPIDVKLLEERVGRALARRRLPRATTAWRWIHGENDDLPGIRVDVYDRSVNVVLDSPSLAGLVDPLIGVLQRAADVDAVWVHGRTGTDDDDWSRVPLGQRVGSRPSADLVVEERGVKVGVRPWDGPDAGLFSDMRDLRAWMAPHWSGRRVLNTFAYTGMFSVAAALGGAASVHSVDLSDIYLDRARANFTLNGLDPEDYVFTAQDTFRALDTLRRKKHEFDCVILDPPSHSHSEAGVWSVARDLGRLVGAALRVLAPGGWIIVATNLGSMSPKEFGKHVKAGSQRVGRPLQLIHDSSPPLDYPALLDFPEARYLKCWVLTG